MSKFSRNSQTGRTPHRLDLNNLAARGAKARRGSPLSNRSRTVLRDVTAPYMPPEKWYPPREDGKPYRIVVEQPGDGFRHILTPDDVRQRLAALPAGFTDKLEVVHFSRMTRKKASAPCYGMQWGATLYLYPIEESLVEEYTAPPTHAQRIEAKMYGARWTCDQGTWHLTWDLDSIRDFYLNNILIHELGHVLDDRNSRVIDRERYAEWFAIEYGYKATQAARQARLGYAATLRRHDKLAYHVSPATNDSTLPAASDEDAA